MATNDKKVNIFLKKFLPQQQITENFLDYLEGLILDSFKYVWNEDGLFEPVIDQTDLYSFSAPDTFTLTTPLIGTDGLGHLMNLDAAEADEIPFENELGVEYYVGLRFNHLYDTTEVNVRTSEIKYTFCT